MLKHKYVKLTCQAQIFFWTPCSTTTIRGLEFINFNFIQEVGGASYTNFKDGNFDCGRYKTYCEIQEDCTGNEKQINKQPRNVTYGGWSYNDDKTAGCSTTLINDRFVISAAHCYEDFQSRVDSVTDMFQGRKITIR